MSSLPVLVLNSGSSSIKFSVYEAGNGERAQALRRRRRRHRHRSGQVLDQGCRRQKAGGSDAARCPTAPSRSSWSPTRSTPASSLPRRPSAIAWFAAARRCSENQLITPAADRRDRELRGLRAAAHAHRRLHHARGAAPVSRHSQLRHSRHLLPSHHAGSRDAHADPRRNTSAMGVRRYGVSRHLLRVDRLSAAAQRAGEADRRASRQRRVDLRHSQRQVPRHLHGPDAHRRHHQRHAHRRHRSRRAAFHPAARLPKPRRTPPKRPTNWKRSSARSPACWA